MQNRRDGNTSDVQAISPDDLDRRDRGGDRRKVKSLFNLQHLRYHLGRGRRHGLRRDRDPGGYVDRYSMPLLLVALGIVVLSMLDATFTLNLLLAGAVEINPVMDRLITENTQAFINAKIALTSLAVILLVVHSNHRVFRRVLVARVLWSILAFYALLVGYELFLLALV